MDDDRAYRVVLNDEEQYSIWPVDRELPAGWYAAGVAGAKQECLDHIAEVWTDMRPLSLRRRMAASTAGTDRSEVGRPVGPRG
jgi:MbtH protein